MDCWKILPERHRGHSCRKIPVRSDGRPFTSITSVKFKTWVTDVANDLVSNPSMMGAKLFPYRACRKISGRRNFGTAATHKPASQVAWGAADLPNLVENKAVLAGGATSYEA
jgi:hypothetical protein